MSEWIADRLPTKEDAWNDLVWGNTIGGTVLFRLFNQVHDGEPWIPINGPEPYVKPEPQRWKPDAFEIYWVVLNNGKVDKYLSDVEIDDYTYDFGNCFKKERHAKEAARRVCETLLNYHKELNND